MTGRALAAVALTGLLVGGCPFASPGLRGDVGIAAASVGGTVGPALHTTVGASLGSIVAPEKLPVDVGLSYALFVAGPRAPVNGIAVDVAWLHLLSSGFRTSLGARGELLLQDRGRLALGSGGAVRFAVEFANASSGDFSGAGESSNGLAWVAGYHDGVLGAGLFVEGGVRRLPGAIFSYYGAVGLTFRLPSAVGVLVVIPLPR